MHVSVHFLKIDRFAHIVLYYLFLILRHPVNRHLAFRRTRTVIRVRSSGTAVKILLGLAHGTDLYYHRQHYAEEKPQQVVQYEHA